MILMNDFKAEPGELRTAMLAAASRVLDSGWYILGNELSAFEKQWADICGVKHAIGVANGMDAIEIGLRALRIGQGDEVITTPMTAFATVLAILRAGATPVLADIDPTSGLLSYESVLGCITRKTKAIVLVHLYGQVRNMPQWTALCQEKNLYLIEDCAQAHLASVGGKVAGSFGIAGAYSFYPTKNLGAPGDAGMLVSNEPRIKELAEQLRNYGQSVRYHHPELGLNSRLDEIHAAMLAVRLQWLPEFTERRRQIAVAYHSGINNPLLTLLAAPEEYQAHSYHLFVVTTPARDALQQHLAACQIQALIHYPIPVHMQPPCLGIKCAPGGLPNAERQAHTCLSLPCHPQMSDAEVQQVIAAVNSFTQA